MEDVKVTTTIRLSEETRKQLKLEALRGDTSMSDVIKKAIYAYINLPEARKVAIDEEVAG